MSSPEAVLDLPSMDENQFTIFVELVRRVAGPVLEGYGFREVNTKSDFSWYGSVEYNCDSVGIDIVFDEQDWSICLWIIKLEGGQRPTNRTYVSVDPNANTFPLIQLVKLRCPSCDIPELSLNARHDYEAWEFVLQLTIRYLVEWGEDVLKGDMSVIESLIEMYRTQAE